MDAEAYLKRHGWRGTGHSLDRTDRGIKKPLQISKKVDALGVGLQKYGAVSDQWWMRAYDQGLKDLGTGKEGDLDKVRQHGHDRGGLYSRFVKGQPIPGTIDEYIARKQTSEVASSGQSDKKHKTRRLHKVSQQPSLSVVGSGQLPPALREMVNSFVAEAMKREIIPLKDGMQLGQFKQPSETDMARVLELAGLPATKQKQKLKRKHTIRLLRRAAMQHIEATHPP